MKEITRIHIAKVAYDIELGAKKEIEKYIAALERYANDPEIFDDIEIRITELLGERGVQADGVITKDDVAAVRAQLGEPSDFAPENAEEIVEGQDGLMNTPRRVYRDVDEAVLGGVLAGFARFFGIDPLWARLLFAVLLFASFGTAVIIYLILWLIIPPAQTAAEKLRMSGQSVTLASIKELAGGEERINQKARVARQVLGGILGTLLVVMAVVSLLAIIAVVFGVQFGLWNRDFSPLVSEWMYGSWWFMTMMGLFILSGLLFSTLCFLLASAVFRRQWSRRIGVAVIAIITAGLIVFAGGVGAGMYGYATEQAQVREMHRTVSGNLPRGFENIKTLTFADGIDADGSIQYHVSDKAYYELDSLPGVEPRFEIAADGLSATVKFVGIDESQAGQTWRPWDFLDTPVLRVYGPALETIEVAQNVDDASYSNNGTQANLTVAVRDNSRFELHGTYDKVSISGGIFTVASLEGAAIEELSVENGGVTAGVVRLLSVKQPDACVGWDTSDPHQQVRVRGISGGRLIYNGTEQPAKTIENVCGKVIVGNENGDGEEQ